MQLNESYLYHVICGGWRVSGYSGWHRRSSATGGGVAWRYGLQPAGG